jgi:hypothetical protein
MFDFWHFILTPHLNRTGQKSQKSFATKTYTTKQNIYITKIYLRPNTLLVIMYYENNRTDDSRMKSTPLITQYSISGG